MSKYSSSSSSSGIGFFGLLAVAFIVLKLVKFQGNPVSSWSWWWVLSPIWICTLLVIAILVLLALGFVIYWLVKRGK